ncbi:non-ribosomal peptide synthetase, partial [Streptomyces sp. NPDC057052]
GKRIYKTGDIARYLDNGSIEYLGRSDFQVKIRGFRIELGEIESQLLNHDYIKEAVVTAKGKGTDQYLCAYFVANRKLVVSDIKEYLASQIPDYMIPTYYVQMEEFPLTPNGKLDRKALPEPDKNMDLGIQYLPPTNPTEAKLVEIYE